MIEKFNISVYLHRKNIYIFSMPETVNNEDYEQLSTILTSKNANSQILGEKILESTKSIITNIIDSPPSANDFAKTFGEKDWNSFVKNTELVLISKENEKDEIVYVVPTIKRRGAWEYDYDSEVEVHIDDYEKIGQTVLDLFGLN